jgi:hypothetical protein
METMTTTALGTGIALGLGTRWGVFRYPWVATKLILVVTVLLVGAFILGPASSQMLDDGTDETGRLIAGAAYDVIALTVATGLGVFKPGKPFRRAAQRSLAQWFEVIVHRQAVTPTRDITGENS